MAQGKVKMVLIQKKVLDLLKLKVEKMYLYISLQFKEKVTKA